MGTPVFVDIVLIPKKKDKPDAAASPNPNGSNPDMIDVREYADKFPKRAVKEFDKGLGADAEGKHDDAIRHYLKAVEIAPDFYLAHNNLGSDYQNKSDFANARKEFERVVQLNQSDAAAYFNLSNVCMLTGQLTEAQQISGRRPAPRTRLGPGPIPLRVARSAPEKASPSRVGPAPGDPIESGDGAGTPATGESAARSRDATMPPHLSFAISSTNSPTAPSAPR